MKKSIILLWITVKALLMLMVAVSFRIATFPFAIVCTVFDFVVYRLESAADKGLSKIKFYVCQSGPLANKRISDERIRHRYRDLQQL